jgi:RNA 3'-terminal phosphate cyclase (ATP)
MIRPCAKLIPISINDRGDLVSTKLRVPVRNLSQSIANRILAAALAYFPCDDASVEPRDPGPGRGVCCLYEAVFENGSELTSAFGELNVTAEQVGKRAAKSLKDFISCGAAVGRHLADQLLLPMALAGSGSFISMVPDDHVATNIAVIEKFLPVKFHISDLDRGLRLVTVK